jgi:hypothetical protein
MTPSEIYQLFTEKNFTVKSDIKYYTPKSDNIEYECNYCKTQFNQRLKDFIRRGAKNGCSGCLPYQVKRESQVSIKDFCIMEDLIDVSDYDEEIVEIVMEIIQPDIINDITGEKWKRIPGGWISTFGNIQSISSTDVLNSKNNLTIYSGDKVKVNKEKHGIKRLIAICFKIPDYEKVLDENQRKYNIHNIDGNTTNNKIENLKIITATENAKIKDRKPFTTNNYFENLELDFDNMIKKVIHKKLDILPNHIIFKNGKIYSEKLQRFLGGSNLDSGYIRIQFSKDSSYLVHRLICFAFNPKPGKNNYEDYNDLQVNHKNLKTTDNNADNLEWVTPSENMNHSYKNGNDNKSRGILQYDKETDELLGEYKSIAEAARQTGDTESQIRTSAKGNGKFVGPAQYYWKHKNPENTPEYTIKYSSKKKK